MHISEYENIYKNEASHFFYVGNHNTVISLLTPFLVGKPKTKVKILDAGCGTGLLAKKMKKYGKVIGIDISPEAIKYSKKRNIDVKKASITKIPYLKNTFDVVVSIDVLYHQAVKNSQIAINEFYRVLKPGGLLIVKVPAYNWLRGKHDITVHTKHRFTVPEVQFKLKRGGFNNIKTTYFASFLLPIVLIKRLVETFTNSKDGHSDVELPNKILNQFFVLLFKIETQILKFTKLPFGLSILGIANKPY